MRRVVVTPEIRGRMVRSLTLALTARRPVFGLLLLGVGIVVALELWLYAGLGQRGFFVSPLLLLGIVVLLGLTWWTVGRSMAALRDGSHLGAGITRGGQLMITSPLGESRLDRSDLRKVYLVGTCWIVLLTSRQSSALPRELLTDDEVAALMAPAATRGPSPDQV